MNNNLKPVTEHCPVVRRKVGKTTYIVKVHFSKTATETMNDKIKRLLKSEVANM